MTNSDISLSDKINFPKFNRQERKIVLQILEDVINYDDIIKYKDLWKSIFRWLHIWEYKNKYKKVFSIFNSIVNNTKTYTTYNSKVEDAIKNNELEVLINLLSDRPWVFARKIHEILRLWNNSISTLYILAHFKDIVENVELKNLLVLEKYFESIDKQEKRTIINKKWKIKIFENNLAKMNKETNKQIISILKEAIKNIISKKKQLLLIILKMLKMYILMIV